MVMAAAPWRGAGWVLVRLLRQPRTGNSTRLLISQSANRPFLALDDLPPLAGVKFVRLRRCAAQSREVKRSVILSRGSPDGAGWCEDGTSGRSGGSVTIVPAAGGP